jgi:hypothetical protein
MTMTDMAERFHIVVFQMKDDTRPVPTPPEALLHARALFYRSRYRTILTMAGCQVMMVGLMAIGGVPSGALLLGVLGQGLVLAAVSGWAAYLTRKDILR